VKRVLVANRGEIAVMRVATTAGLHRAILAHPDFLAGRVHTRWVETELARA
jgi:biotin carboxylase